MGRKFLTKQGIGIRSALRQSLVSWLSISRKKASLFLQMTQSRGSDFENDIHTMIKHSNEYATWKKFADEKNLEIYLQETKAKDKCCVRLVIFWTFYPQRTDIRQPCQEEVERVIHLFLTQCNTFSHEENIEYIKNILWVNRMPYILPCDADTGKNKKTYEEMLSITADPTKIITLQLMDLLPNVEKVLILGGRAWNFFGDMIPKLVSQAGPITHLMN